MTSAHDHGSLGEEAARLAEAVQDWLRGAARGGMGGGAGMGGGPGAAGTPGDPWAEATAPRGASPECLVCPICQGLRLLRSTRPEVFEHLSDAAASLSAALRELVVEPPGPRPRDGGVEHIDLG